MSQPQAAKADNKNTSLVIRGAIWIAIGALIAAALVCVVWVLIGDQNGLIGRAFLTILLLAAFAGIAILEAGLAPNRPDWLALASMISWIVALIVGAVKIWLPEEDDYFGSGAERFFQLLLVVGILQLALLHVRLFTPAAQRYVTTFTRVIYMVTLVFLIALAAMLIFFLTLPNTIEYSDLYWRIVVALTILAAVGTTLIPLLNALFAPKAPRATPAASAAPALQPWPTYADGATPLPMLHDGSPDWNAYYTGYPTPQQAPVSAAAWGSAPAVAAPVTAAPVPETPPAPPAAESAPSAHEAPAAEIPPIPPMPPTPSSNGLDDIGESPAPAPEQAPPAAPSAPGAFPPPPPAAPVPPQ
ncbi:MAG: hypothetical protein ACQEW8_07280 [Actinomycetota bacterium]